MLLGALCWPLAAGYVGDVRSGVHHPRKNRLSSCSRTGPSLAEVSCDLGSAAPGPCCTCRDSMVCKFSVVLVPLQELGALVLDILSN